MFAVSLTFTFPAKDGIELLKAYGDNMVAVSAYFTTLVIEGIELMFA